MTDLSPQGDIMQADVVTKPSRIPGGNGGSITPIRSPEHARELSRIRWEGVSRAARLGIAAAGEQLPDVSSRAPLKVVQYLAEMHTMHAAVPSAPGAVQSFKQVMALAYPAPDRATAADAPSPGGLQLNLDAGAVRALLDELRRRQAGQDEQPT